MQENPGLHIACQSRRHGFPTAKFLDMSSQDAYQPPPLEDILRTLSRFSSTPLNGQNTAPETVETSLTPSEPQNSSAEVQSRQAAFTSQQSSAAPVSKGPQVDPSTITSWPQALKYVVSDLSQNGAASSRIKTLIHSQQRHEKQWWTGRENLTAKQKGRGEGKKKADDLLRLLGSKPDATSGSFKGQSTEAEAERKELEVYDNKVYKALSEMSRAMDGELRGLGIPFFAIKHELVDVKATSGDNASGLSSTERSTAVLGRDELLTLQKQMLQLLEALFGD